jgi:hypothetical protein
MKKHHLQKCFINLYSVSFVIIFSLSFQCITTIIINMMIYKQKEHSQHCIICLFYLKWRWRQYDEIHPYFCLTNNYHNKASPSMYSMNINHNTLFLSFFLSTQLWWNMNLISKNKGLKQWLVAKRYRFPALQPCYINLPLKPAWAHS